MNPTERQARIESYAQAYLRLEAALREFPPEMWTYRPDEHDWTIHEIIIHITDGEVNSYVRCRRLIAEPNSDVMGYDEMAWARIPGYHNLDTGIALELFRLLRRSSYELIRDLPEDVWAHTVVHSESGRMNLDDWLITYERHIPQHIAQMRAVFETWRLEQAH